MTERGERFPQGAGWEHPPVANTRAGIQADQIEISGQTMVLESIIEHEDLRVEERHSLMTDAQPVHTDEHRHTGRAGGEHHRLIAHFLEAAKNVSSVRDDRDRTIATTAIASTGDHDPMAAI
jgi:hypothetical protein